MASPNGKSVVSLDFEVFGHVQGVFFRKHTQKTAVRLGIVGYVRNTKNETVVGHAEGTEPHIKTLKIWLETKGSPTSKIEKCIFTNERRVASTSTSDFIIK